MCYGKSFQSHSYMVSIYMLVISCVAYRGIFSLSLILDHAAFAYNKLHQTVCCVLNQIRQVSPFYKIMPYRLMFFFCLSNPVSLHVKWSVFISGWFVVLVHWLVCCVLCCGFYDAVFVWPALVGLLVSDGVQLFSHSTEILSKTQCSYTLHLTLMLS